MQSTLTEPDRWLASYGQDLSPEARIRLFCFSHAGGGAAFYRPWRLALAPDVDTRAVVLPGRESRVRELPFRRVEQLLDPVCDALEPLLDQPYALFGHSMGSIVAYEVARRLVARAAPAPVALVVSGRRAPSGAASRRLFSTMPDAEFLSVLSGLNGTPPEVLRHPQLIGALLPALRADFELNERYDPLPGPVLSCPVAAYMGDTDPEVDHVELLGWRAETTGEFTMRVFPGDHFYLRNGRPDVLSAVRQDLCRALESDPTAGGGVHAQREP